MCDSVNHFELKSGKCVCKASDNYIMNTTENKCEYCEKNLHLIPD